MEKQMSFLEFLIEELQTILNAIEHEGCYVSCTVLMPVTPGEGEEETDAP